MRKNKSKVCFVESSFGQTFPVAQYRIASPFQNGANVVCLQKTNTNSFILSRAHINISSNERNLSLYKLYWITFQENHFQNT
jgi:hypothetical protein